MFSTVKILPVLPSTYSVLVKHLLNKCFNTVIDTDPLIIVTLEQLLDGVRVMHCVKTL